MVQPQNARARLTFGFYVTVEDYRPGYPQFSALVGSHDAFHVYRRFSSTRARLLLLKQDRVSALEQQLEKIDHEETSPLFLGAARRDCNAARLQVLDDIDAALAEYGRSFAPLNQQAWSVAQCRNTNRYTGGEESPDLEPRTCQTERYRQPAELDRRNGLRG